MSMEIETEIEKETCCVCLDEIQRSPITCGHMVHRDCLVRTGSKLCPICREPFRLTRCLETILAYWWKKNKTA